jgi:hypothetical protein
MIFRDIITQNGEFFVGYKAVLLIFCSILLQSLLCLTIPMLYFFSYITFYYSIG